MSIVLTSQARCRDCYKCIRNCPVKAIGLRDGQAWVVEEKCIVCGRCIKACPQNAKSTLSQAARVGRWLDDGQPVYISLAPSYLANSRYSSPWKWVAGLKAAGAARVEETAVAAEWIGAQYRKLAREGQGRTYISSCCPVVVNMVEKIFPNLTPYLAGILSPMAAHVRQLKMLWGSEIKVVFVGPCFGKKAEDDQTVLPDAVLTFDELDCFLKTRAIDPEALPDRQPDAVSTQARLFPLHQGIAKVAGLEPSFTAHTITINGVEECLATFRDLELGLIQPDFIEALACAGGCIGGPGMSEPMSIAGRRTQLCRLAGSRETGPPPNPAMLNMDLHRKHHYTGKSPVLPDEKEIRRILALTGKNMPEDETNCGGCGYSSCREKAIAVFQGLAEPEMCIPYMKNKAESFSNTIVETTLNAIIVADEELRIQKFNPAATRMFKMRSKEAEGEALNLYLDPTDFRTVLELQKTFVGIRSYPQLGLTTRQIIYALPKYKAVIGVITDITADEARKEKFDQLRRAALERASRVIHEQMRTAQEIAGLLGESTAETKATLLELIEIMEGESGEGV